MKRPVKLGITTLKALGTVVALGAAAHASLPYLPLIGPPPLRLLAVKHPSAAVIKFVAPPAAAATNPAPTVAAGVFPGVTNATSSGTPAFAGPLIGPGAEQSLGDTFTGSVFALPTPDLLGITPQMLATYFHPVQFGTNAPDGLIRIGFMPPLPPETSSHAEYILK